MCYLDDGSMPQWGYPSRDIEYWPEVYYDWAIAGEAGATIPILCTSPRLFETKLLPLQNKG